MKRMVKNSVFRMAFFLAICSAFVTAAHAIDLTISKGKFEQTPVAITSFEASDPQMLELSRKITAVISDDLYKTGLFRLIDPTAFIQKDTSIHEAPRFADWRLIKTKAVLVGRLSRAADGRMQTEFRLWDVILGKQLTGQQFAANPDNWRRVAHIIADAVYERLTGEKGYFDTRVVFVDETGPKNNRVKRLAIMDQDGANVRLLSEGRSLVLTPRFSPTSQQITYMSYETGKPRVNLLNIDTGQSEMLGDFPNMTFAPRFSPDGRSIIMSLSSEGNSNLYIMDLASRQMKQVTFSNAIDTAPSFSPDGRQVVFESDREGSQQLYIHDMATGQARRISQGAGRYATPVWSPRGDLIAFTKNLEGRFIIGVMNIDGSGERVLTEGYHNEGPTWSPNGRVVMFFRESPGANGGPRIFSVDLTGYNERQISTPSFASDPAWSPIIN